MVVRVLLQLRRTISSALAGVENCVQAQADQVTGVLIPPVLVRPMIRPAVRLKAANGVLIKALPAVGARLVALVVR